MNYNEVINVAKTCGRDVVALVDQFQDEICYIFTLT